MKVKKKFALVRGQKKNHPCVWSKHFLLKFLGKKSSPGKVTKKKKKIVPH